MFLASRIGRRIELTSNSGTVDLGDESMFYETIVLRRTTLGAQTVEFTVATYQVLPEGAYTTIIVWNTCGSTVATTFNFGGAGAAVNILDTEAALLQVKNAVINTEVAPYALGVPVDLNVPT